MQLDVMMGPVTWAESAAIARQVESAGLSGMMFTETGQTPWMSMAAAAAAAPSLAFLTGIAVAFPVSPMVAASLAWELAGNTGGRFRLGLGSQVKAHVERRYGAEFDPPGPRLRDYVLAVKDCLAAFAGERRLDHRGPYYELTLLPSMWRPPRHEFGDIRVDISAVGPWMTEMAGEVADGVHVHPLHSEHYLHQRLLPAVRAGAERAGRDPGEVDLLVPVFIVPGDSHEARAELAERARFQLAFYGSTKNYAFQFDDLGWHGTSARLNELLKAGDLAGMAATISDEMLDTFAVVGPWDEIVERLRGRYDGVAARIISYLTLDDVARHPEHLGRWGEIARALRDTEGAHDERS